MTPSVADKTPLSDKVWRRHQDPPGLWIAVVIGSLSLHLLAFWLMRSSGAFRPWFPQQSQAITPIELIEISPQTSVAETQPQAPKTTTEAAPATSTNQDEQSVSFGDDVQPDNSRDASQTDTQVLVERTPPQPKPTPTPTPEATQPTPTPTPTATQPTPTVPLSDRPWERRQDIELGKGTPLPSDAPPVTPEQIAESEAVEDKTPRTQDEEPANTSNQEPSSTSNGEIVSNSSSQNSSTTEDPASNSNVDAPSTLNGETAGSSSDNSLSNPETTNSPSAENSPTANAGGFIANVFAIGDNEARQLVQQGTIRNRDIPGVFASYQGSTKKTLDDSSSYLPSNSTLQPAKLLVSLIIDQNGKFQQAQVLELPSDLQAEKSLYEQLINDLFKNDSCTPAKNQDGTPIDLSNCYIWIDIKPQTAN